MKEIKIFVNFFELIQKERVRKYIQNNLKSNPLKDHKVPCGLWTIYIYIHYIVVHNFYNHLSMHIVRKKKFLIGVIIGNDNFFYEVF